MYLSLESVKNASVNAVVACVPKCYSNYTGIATVHTIANGVIEGNPDCLQNACLFPVGMIQEAIENNNLYLEGGDWGVWSLPEGIETCPEYYGFRIELMGSH